jgi:beta-lactamase regulating signal transducer with metallopeptidase domain
VIELINWLICGTLLAAATHAVSLSAPRVSASPRYHLWWLTLATILAAPMLPMLLPEQGVSMVRAVQSLPSVEVPAATPVGGWLLAGVWAAMAAYSLTRIVIAAVVLRRRKREALPFPTAIESQLPLWNARTGARAARLCVSPVVRSAAVFGGRHPAIAVSPGLLRALTPRELDLVLMHEWAHVQRYDDAANAVQQVVRSVFGMHPGVRWCARQLDLQRELACDARVVHQSGSSRAYAACLARLAEMVNPRGNVALAPGVLAGSHLSTRVTAVLRARPRVSRWQTGGFVTTGIAALVGVAVSTAQLAAVRAPVQAAADLVANALPAAAAAAVAPRPSAASEVTSNRPFSTPRVRAATQLRPTSVDLRQDAARRSSTRPATGVLPAPDEPRLSDDPVAVPELATTEFGAGAGADISIALPAAPSASQEDPGTWSRVADAGAIVGRKTSDAGVAIGRTSSDAARSTAGFFNRIGKSIGGRF